MASFTLLPAEIKILIFEELVQSHTCYARPRQSVAAYACVDKTWQAYFEELTFRDLVLSQSDLHDFQAKVNRSRRPHVKTIWLRIKLPDNCAVNSFGRPRWIDPGGSMDNDNIIFTHAILRLWSILRH